MTLRHAAAGGVFRAAFIAVIFAAAIAAGSGAPAALAQSASVQPNLGGLGIDSGQPVKIDADRFEVFDDRKQAIFSGNVILQQGPVKMQTSRLLVSYTGGTGQQQGRINRLEASGKVIVTSKEQTATGEKAIYEVGTRVIRLSGNVVLTQGDNVIRGEELVVDLTTGTSKLVGTGRVRGLFLPGGMQNPGQN